MKIFLVLILGQGDLHSISVIILVFRNNIGVHTFAYNLIMIYDPVVIYANCVLHSQKVVQNAYQQIENVVRAH